MPRTTLKITNGQRDALYEQVRNHVASFGDLWIALETNRDYAAAERLAVEFSEDFHLLEDLGWNPEDGRLMVELTMEAHDLMEVVRRLRDEAQGGLMVVATSERQRPDSITPSRTSRQPAPPARTSLGC